MSKHTAVGIHVFAGGFTHGVKCSGLFDVTCQLEAHGFGVETTERTFRTPVINEASADKGWPRFEAEFMYGNPRCTGFSTVTSGYDDSVHGPWAKQTCDVHQLCDYARGKADIVVWESVQQAFTTGRPLIDYLVGRFAEKGYRVAHLFINAATFGNVQQRKRYFFVAYRDDRNFNISPPDVDPYYSVAIDELWKLRDRKTRPGEVFSGENYDADSYRLLTPDELHCVPHLAPGICLNRLGKYRFDLLPENYKECWKYRTSELPFSLHSITRVAWLRPFPTLMSSAFNYIHPEHNRPITVGEAAAVMGWGEHIPQGPKPFAQIAKGVVPAVGQWLAKQAAMYLDDEWGDEDYESSFNPVRAEWEGRDTHGQLEKTFDMTKYVGYDFDRHRYPEVTDEILFKHRLHVERRAG